MIAMQIFLIIFELIALSFQTGGFQQDRVEVIMNIEQDARGVGAGSIPDLSVEELSYQKKRLRNQKKWQRKRKKLQVRGISTKNPFAALCEEGGEEDEYENESGEDDTDVVEKNAGFTA